MTATIAGNLEATDLGPAKCTVMRGTNCLSGKGIVAWNEQIGPDDDDMMSGLSCHSCARSMGGGIDDRPAGLNDSARSKAGRLQATLPHNVKNGFPAGDKIIGDNAAVASPPYRL
jgi:hypothetical protein